MMLSPACCEYGMPPHHTIRGASYSVAHAHSVRGFANNAPCLYRGIPRYALHRRLRGKGGAAFTPGTMLCGDSGFGAGRRNNGCRFEPHDGASHEIASCAQLAAARLGRRTGCVPAGIVISFGVDGIVTFMPLRGGQRETAQVLHIVHEGFFVLHCARLC